MAAMKFSANHPTQSQNKNPSFRFLAGWLWTAASSTSSLTKFGLLTAYPRIDNIYGQVESEVNHNDADRHDENDALGDEIVAGADRRDQLIPETRNAQEVLDNETTGQEATDIDAGSAEQGDRRRSKRVSPHDATLADSLGA